MIPDQEPDTVQDSDIVPSEIPISDLPEPEICEDEQALIELVDKAFEAWCQKRGLMKKWRNGQKPQPGEDPEYDSAMNFFQAQRKDNLRKRLVRERCIHYIFEKRKKA